VFGVDNPGKELVLSQRMKLQLLNNEAYLSTITTPHHKHLFNSSIDEYPFSFGSG
jgi:hypothetical protein